MSNNSQKFSASLAKEAQFEAGLRGCFEYRDLGINDATHGQYHAAISRVRSEFKGDQNIRTTGMHRHLCDFQMFYVLKGWVTMYYEGEGEVTLHAGDNCLQPAGISHNEVQCSEDFECLEIYSPATHETVAIDGDES
jgi:mannose-6-phosphate isomerase-like protein (cupin superfamily)